MNKKTVKIIRLIILVICIGLLVAGGYMFYKQQIAPLRKQKKLQDMYHGKSKIIELDTKAAAEQSEAAFDILDFQNSDAAVHPDFAALYAVNPDLAGWLEAEGAFSLPVTQRDNEYYLDHDFYGRSCAEGMAFVNADCRLRPQDRYVMIHGHNMRSGAVFGNLDLYRDETYLRAHPILTFRTIRDEAAAAYAPVAAFDASVDPDEAGYVNIARISFDSDGDFLDYARSLTDASLMRLPLDVTGTDRLLALVTCSYDQNDGRFVLLLRKLRPDENEDAVRALFLEEGM